MVVGTVAFVALAATGVGVGIAGSGSQTDGTAVVLRTEKLGDGITVGTRVRADGVLVGAVTDIAATGIGTQMVTLDLDRSQLDGIDDSLRVDFATSNLFGISEIQLRPGAGGAALEQGSLVDLTGARSADAVDATMGALLGGLSGITDQAMATRVATVIDTLATDVRAFSPLLQAVVTTAQITVDNRTMPTSRQLDEYGRMLSGLAPFAGSTVDVMDRLYRISVLRTDRARFDETIGVVVHQLFPGVQVVGASAEREFDEFAAMAVPLLAALARTVPHPQQSSADLAALIAGLRAAMPESPDGPVLNVDLDLRIAPVPVVPLLDAVVPR